MTNRGQQSGDESTPRSSQSLRDRALVAYQAKYDGATVNETQFSSEDGLRAIHELRVHQIELEMQNEELRRSQQLLNESRKHYLSLYDGAPVGYCLVGADGLIQEANLKFAEMVGTSPKLLQQDRFSKFIDKDDQDVFYLLRRKILASSESQTCELRLQNSDGIRKWVQLSVSLASDVVDKELFGVILLDIDARIQAEMGKASLEAQLRESQKMEAVGTLAGGIAHDFNNILSIILGNAELAHQLTIQSDPQTFQCVEEIQKAGERASVLVKQLLAFCRRQPTDRKPIALAPAIEESIRLLRSTLPARVNLSFASALDVPNVLADYTQIEQIVINLATNAVQAMTGGPGSIIVLLDSVERLTVALKPGLNSQSHHLVSSHWQNYNTLVRLTFSDDGPGIEPNILERIFEPFFTTKPVNQGTGLGLAVVHGIVHAHDGEIFVESQLGKGTTFIIYFPPANPSEMENLQEHEIGHSDKENLSQMFDCRILYIDDDEMVLRSITNVLRHYGIHVHGYSDQRTALAALRSDKNGFDVVVTDYNMPSISGLEVARQVRQIREDLPIILTSGLVDDELQSLALEAGVNALIPKPFSTNHFCDLVKALSNHQAE